MKKFGNSKSGMDVAKLNPASQHYQPQAFKRQMFPVLGLGDQNCNNFKIYFRLLFNSHF